MREVLARVRLEGPLQAKDFESHGNGKSGSMWEWSPVKQAIEYLFMEGKLLVTRRENFQKVFDLAERVVPTGVDTRTPSRSEYAHYLVDRYLGAHGLGQPAAFSYLRPGMAPAVKRALAQQLEAGTIVALRIRGVSGSWYARHDFAQTLERRLARSRPCILSPFDNLVIQRKRVQQLFGFDYQLECYLPAARRKYGYFCLPILWNGELVGRMDAKADRRRELLKVHSLTLEREPRRPDEFSTRFCRALRDFARFNQCEQLHFARVTPGAMDAPIRDAWRRLPGPW